MCSTLIVRKALLERGWPDAVFGPIGIGYESSFYRLNMKWGNTCLSVQSAVGRGTYPADEKGLLTAHATAATIHDYTAWDHRPQLVEVVRLLRAYSYARMGPLERLAHAADRDMPAPPREEERSGLRNRWREDLFDLPE
ncbi:MAG: hypothetical protein Q8P18_33250 [Pseudomonadota bacterium]|nr:hypothetical protein [Pseudomonadota bacterium]